MITPVCAFPATPLRSRRTDIAVQCRLLTTRSSTAQGDRFKIANTAYFNSLEANLSCPNRQVNSWDSSCLQRAVCFSSSWTREMPQQLWRKAALVLQAMNPPQLGNRRRKIAIRFTQQSCRSAQRSWWDWSRWKVLKTYLVSLWSSCSLSLYESLNTWVKQNPGKL